MAAAAIAAPLLVLVSWTNTLECREFRAHAGAQRNREKCGEFRREKREWKERDETARA